MSNEDDPAFPMWEPTQGVWIPGLSAKQYAAIHLRVPSSGVDWLDDMIREANGAGQDPQLADLIATGRTAIKTYFDEAKGEVVTEHVPASEWRQPDYYDGEWHDWHGGECPVPDAKSVEYQCTNGYGRTSNMTCVPWNFVILFRVVKP